MKTPALCCLVCLQLILSFSGYSQTVKEPNFASPNAASLGKYADIPVSYHTGVPEISVPIYTIQEGSLSVPISLSYHSSGIRVDEVASWVGLGWSLNAGGMITRTVQGGPDEGIVYGSLGGGGNSPYQRWGWYKNYGRQPTLTACGPTPLLTTNNSTAPWNGGCATLYWEAANGYVDSEPDLFTFNFGSYSGKFFFDESRKVHMIPESDLYIKPVNSPSFFYAWMIITPDGTKYFFGGSATEISWSDPAENSGNKHVNSSTTWYLYRIESVNGENWINFEYADDTYSFGNRGGNNVAFREFTYAPGGGTDPKQPGEVLDVGSIIQEGGIINTTLVDGKRLTKITTSSGYTTIDFTTSASAREDLTRYYLSGSIPIYDVNAANTLSKSLQFIQITTPSLCKKFELSQDYFPSANCTGCASKGFASFIFDQKRLRLNWVQESSCTGDLLPSYEFTYDSQPIPRRYSLAKDMWGYYNGIEANKGLLEAFSNPMLPGVSYTTGNYRPVDESKAKAGILTKIKYPTGGTSEFAYEAHREGDLTPALGGLRIKTLTTTDNFGNSTIKNFKYPSGTLYLNPANYTNHYPNNNDNWTNSFLGGFDFSIIHSSNPIPPMWSTQGYHIGYTKVRVEEPGNGFTIFRYLNTSPTLVNPAKYPFEASVAAIGTSELVNQSFHVEGTIDENIYVSNTSMTNQSTSTSNALTVRRVQLVNCINCTSIPTDFGIWMDYPITTYRFNLTSKTETRDGVSTTTTYTYDTNNKHNNPKTIQYTSSTGVAHRTDITYPSDAGSGAPAAMYDSANANFKNILNAAIEQKNYVNGTLSEKTTNTYSQYGSLVLLTSTKSYPTGTTAFVENQYEYDTNANLVKVVKSDGVNSAFLWGYNNQYPIAAAKNVLLSSVTNDKTMVIGTAVSANTSSCTNLTGSLTLTDAQTVTFNPSVQLSAAGLWIKLTMKDASGTVKFGPKQYTTAGNYNESVALPPGTYSFCYEAGNFPVPYTGYSAINFTVNYFLGYRRNIFHTSFEDNGVTNTSPKTGSKVWSGTYGVIMPNVNGDYMLSYWKKQNIANAPWVYQEQPITISVPNTADYVIGQSGYFIDEVRLYPKNTQMSTYTYLPSIGIQSQTDQNQITGYYEYDTSGRLKLIKNDNGEIVKVYNYSYQIK